MVAVIINTSSAFYVYFIMPHPYPEATHRRIYRLARYGYKKRMSNDDRSQTITHSPLSSAVWTGLEPATPCVTGRYSNQLNYHTIYLGESFFAFAMQSYDAFFIPANIFAKKCSRNSIFYFCANKFAFWAAVLPPFSFY